MIQNMKQTAINAISSLPDTATFEDAMYRLYVLEKIAKGEDDIKKGRIISHDDLMKEMQSW
jgi:predicted transcriptional regulator